MRTLLDMVKEYQALLERKDELATLTKENTAAIEAAKLEITQQMIDDDCPRISTGGYTFTLQSKTAYSKRSEAEMAETGADFFSTCLLYTSRRSQLHRVQEAIDSERVNPHPKPLADYPVKMSLYDHQVRGANMCLVAFGWASPDEIERRNGSHAL